MGFWSWLASPAELPRAAAQHAVRQPQAPSAATEQQRQRPLSSRLHPALTSWLPMTSLDEPLQQHANRAHIQMRLRLPGLQAGLQLAPDLLQPQHFVTDFPASCSQTPPFTNPAPARWQTAQGSTFSQSRSQTAGLQPLSMQPAAAAATSEHSSRSSTGHDAGGHGPFALRTGAKVQPAETASSSSDAAARSQRPTQDMAQTVKLLIAGGLAGAISKTATAPLARLTILYQVSPLLLDSSHAHGSCCLIAIEYDCIT